MKKILSVLIVLCLLSTLIIASCETVKMAGSTGTLYLRTGPGPKYSTNGTVNNGDTITVLSKGKVWTKIQTSDSREGYIKNLYISGLGKNYADGTTYYSSSKSGTIKTKYKTSTVNMRAGANKSEALCTTLKSGAKVKVIGKNGSWYLVQNSAGVQGYVSSKYVSVGGGSSSSSSSSSKTAKVTASAVNLRKDKTKNSARLAVLTKNTKVTVLSKANKYWWKVKYGSKTGYIYSKYLK